MALRSWLWAALTASHIAGGSSTAAPPPPPALPCWAITFTFEDETVGACPSGWTCTGDGVYVSSGNFGACATCTPAGRTPLPVST